MFIMDNNGYGIIKQFQDKWLGGRHMATGVSTGVTRPNFIAVSKAYGMKTVTIKNNKELIKGIKKVLKMKGPVLCRVIIDEMQPLIPKLDYGDTLENMSPKL
jgi:acetolactate synthase-1/2/3 large subunit